MPDTPLAERADERRGGKKDFKKYRWYIIGGLALVALLAFFMYRNKQANASSTNSAPGTSGTASSGLDPNTGLPYASEYGGFGGGYYGGTGPAGPAGPAGPQGPRGPGGKQGPPGKPPVTHHPKPKPKHHHPKPKPHPADVTAGRSARVTAHNNQIIPPAARAA